MNGGTHQRFGDYHFTQQCSMGGATAFWQRMACVFRQPSPTQPASPPCGDGTTAERCSSWRQTAPDDETNEKNCSGGFESADILYGTHKDDLSTLGQQVRRFTQLCLEVRSLVRTPLLIASNHS